MKAQTKKALFPIVQPRTVSLSVGTDSVQGGSPEDITGEFDLTNLTKIREKGVRKNNEK